MLLLSFSNRSKRSFLKLTRSTKMCGHFQRHPCKIRLSDVSNETDQTQTLQADTSKANNCTAIYVAEISCSTITIMQSLLFKAALYSINYPEKLQLKHKTNTHTHKKLSHAQLPKALFSAITAETPLWLTLLKTHTHTHLSLIHI